MINKLIRKMADALLNNSLLNIDMGIFMAQLIAFAKVADTGIYTHISGIGKLADQPDCRAEIKRHFKTIYEEKLLGKNSDAFKIACNLDDLKNDRLEQLCLLVDSATKSGILEYSGCVPAIADVFSNRNDGFCGVSKEVGKLMVSLAGIQEKDSVYCPYATSYNLASSAGLLASKVFTESIRKNPLPFIINILLDIDLNASFGNPVLLPGWLENKKLCTFDISLAMGPFSYRYMNEDLQRDWFERFPEKTLSGDVLQTRHILTQTKKRGVIAISNGFLGRTSSGERDFKQWILNKGILEAVIALPPNLLSGTIIPFSLLVFNKEKKSDKITFIDATSEQFYETDKKRSNTLRNIDKILDLYLKKEDSDNSYCAEPTECKENRYNLAVSRYVLSPEQKFLKNSLENSDTEKLEDLAELIRPQATGSKKDVEGTGIFEVGIADIPESGFIPQPKRAIEIDEKRLEKVRKQILKPMDILVVIKGTIGIAGIVPKEFEGKWLASQAFQIVRIKKNSIMTDPVVLFMYLRSELGQSLLKSRISGTSAVSTISIKEMKNLPVMMISGKEQLKVAETFRMEQELQQQVENLKSEMKKLRSRHWCSE